MIRRIAAVVAAMAMLLILALPVMAGGWADIVADGQTATPRAGTPVEIGFRVMQHGVTPAPWEKATVHFLNASTGEAFAVVARNDDPNGHFVATARIPEAGFWTWNVTLQDLATTQTPVPFTVLSRSGVAPALDTAALLAAIDRAKSEAITSVTNQYGPEIDRLQGHEVDRGIELVRALGRPTRADVQRGVAIDGNRLNRADGRDHIIADVAQRLDHVRPFLRRRDFEGLRPAFLP